MESVIRDSLQWCLYDCPGRYPGSEWEWIDGQAWCFSAIVCAEGLRQKIDINDEGGRKICVPTQTLQDEFWETALVDAGVPAELRHGKWIGGVARRYGSEGTTYYDADEADYFENEVGSYSPGGWALHADTADYALYPAFSGWVASVAAGTETTLICYGHDCHKEYNCPEGECGTIGGTSEDFACRAYLWDNTEGLFFVVSVDEGDEVCADAYRQVASYARNQASVSSLCQYDDGGQVEHKGKTYRLHVEWDCEVDEISLVESGRDRGAWVSAKDFG